MSDTTERKESSGEGVNKEPTTVTTTETTVQGNAEAETVSKITVATADETAAETIVTVDEPTTTAKTDSVHTEEVTKTEPSPTKEPTKKGPFIPKGKYALVSVDVDTTGRRLIDEVNNQGNITK